jgi:hypothetical protein
MEPLLTDHRLGYWLKQKNTEVKAWCGEEGPSQLQGETEAQNLTAMQHFSKRSCRFTTRLTSPF